MLRSLFEGAGLRVAEAASPGQAVRTLLLGPSVNALVASGDAEGILVLVRWVRHWVGRPDLPLVVLVERDLPVPLVGDGPVLMMEKPLDLGTLRRTVVDVVTQGGTHCRSSPSGPCLFPPTGRLPAEAVSAG